MHLEEIPAEELAWTDQPVIGMTLRLTRPDMHDSYGKPIVDDKKYLVAKHIPSGMIIVLDADIDYNWRQLENHLLNTNRMN